MFNNTSILLIRHAEKPGKAGIDAVTDGPNLSPQGWQRAKAYVNYFQNFKAVALDGQVKQVGIDYVFSAADDYPMSYRPRLTVSLFADFYQDPRPLLPCVADKSYKNLVTQLEGDEYAGKDILVCWHHGQIINLANALLTANGTRTAPILGKANCWPPPNATWPGSVFGWLFQIRFDQNGEPDDNWTRCLNEKLMPDDTEDPCSGWPIKQS